MRQHFDFGLNVQITLDLAAWLRAVAVLVHLLT